MSVEWKPNGEWFQVSPFGEFPNWHGEERIVQVMDRAGMEEQVRRIRARAAAEGEKFGGLLINQDHLCLTTETAPTRAMGWIMDLEVREDGLWARAKWSTEGERMISGGEYRFVSGEWNGSDVDDLGGGRRRLKELVGCALTNQPNLPGLTPLCNRRSDVKNNKPAEPAESEKNMDIKELAALLGLDESATAEDVKAAVKSLLEAKTAAEEEKKERDAEAFVEANRAKISDKEAVKAAWKRDPEGTAAILAAVKAQTTRTELPVTARVPAKTPEETAGFTAPDGKVYANRTAYYDTLKGKARREFREKNYVELMAETRTAAAK